jgi:hypothetical protein
VPNIRKPSLDIIPQQSPLRLAHGSFSTTDAPHKAPPGVSHARETSPKLAGDALATAAAGIPVYNLDEEIPEPDRAHPQLTLIAGDLTSVAVLCKLIDIAKRLRPARTVADAFPTPIHVVGPGAEYSAAHPYRSPEAQELRGVVSSTGILLIEPPEGAALPAKSEVRRFMAERFLRQERDFLELSGR